MPLPREVCLWEVAVVLLIIHVISFLKSILGQFSMFLVNST